MWIAWLLKRIAAVANHVFFWGTGPFMQRYLLSNGSI